MYPSIPIIAHLPKIHGFLTSPQSKNGSHGSPSSSSTRALAWSEGSSYDLSGGVIFLWLRRWRICWIAWFSEKTHGFLFSIKAIQRKDPWQSLVIFWRFVGISNSERHDCFGRTGGTFSICTHYHDRVPWIIKMSLRIILLKSEHIISHNHHNPFHLGLLSKICKGKHARTC